MTTYVCQDQESFHRQLEILLAEIGLQNFRLDNVRLAGEPKIVARIWKDIEIKERDFHPANFGQILNGIYKDLSGDILESPEIAVLEARRADEVQILWDTIQTLQNENMKLSGANEQLEKMLIGKIPDKQPES